ncbi:hypothetical protein B6Q59_20385 [Escherichia coli]|nr:hypothetical protein [Escherichia coli]EFO2866671.1 hypothetical protein [Escherichia coli]
MSVKLTIVFTDLGNNQCHSLIRVENGDNATLEEAARTLGTVGAICTVLKEKHGNERLDLQIYHDYVKQLAQGCPYIPQETQMH